MKDEILELYLSQKYHPGAGPAEALMFIKTIAVNPETPPSVLEQLAHQQSTEILERVAENKNTPRTVLARLAMHPCSEVRSAVADNVNTPEEVLWMLARDEDPNVRYQLADNFNLPVVVLELLADDDNPYVCNRAQVTLERLGRFTRIISKVTRWFKRRGDQRKFA